MTRRAVVAGLCVLCAIAAACSSSDDDPASPGGVTAEISLFGDQQLDPAQYSAALELVCSDPVLGGDIGDPVGASSTVEEIDAQYDKIETRLQLLQEAPPPADGEVSLDDLTETYDRVLLALDELSASVDRGDTQAAVLVASGLDGLRTDADRQAAVLNAPSCGL